MPTRNQIIFTVIGVLAIGAMCTGAYFYKQRQDTRLHSATSAPRSARPRVLSQFLPIKDKVTIVNKDEALGHRMTIEDDQDSRFLVSLYFVECPPVIADETTNFALARLARYFGNVPLEHIVETGKKAREYSLHLLETRPFRLITRFSPTKNRHGIHGFLLLRAEDNTEDYLCELLVREGLAAITVEGSYLPYGELAADFREHLILLEKEARAAKRGAWAYSRSQDEGGATSENPESQTPATAP